MDHPQTFSVDSNNQVSIQLLLDELCKSLYKDVNATKQQIAPSLYQPSGQQKCVAFPEDLLKKCKKKAFEILLKKSNVKSLSSSRLSLDEGYSDGMDPVRELQYSQFEYSIFVGEVRPYFGPYGFIKEREEKKILYKYELFKECVRFVDGNEHFSHEQCDGYSILWFLNLMKNKSSVDTLLTVEPYFSLALDQVPSFPVMQANYFKLNWEPSIELNQNPYCGAMRTLNRRSNLFRLPGLMDVTPTESNVQMPLNIVEEVLANVKRRIRPNNIYYESNRWEHRGLCIPLNKDTDPELIASLYEKKFITEVNDAPLNIMAIAAAKRGERFQARIVDKKLFNEHIKLLMIGIETESFAYVDNIKMFTLMEHVTIENVPPEIINNFVSNFIECGSCFKQLKSLIHSNNFQLKYNGFVFKALCSSLDRYLETFRSAIIVEKEETIGALSVRVRPLIKQIRMLAHLLAVHPKDSNRQISYGSEFLGYLYNEITSVIQQDVYALLVFILSQCCDVYFRRFSNWIYHGMVEDPGQELFIEFMNYYLPKTKSFFDKAFVVKQSSVPGFLQGWEHSILLCGKYSNLLKLYNPMHPLFTVAPPQITVCLSFAQIHAVQSECQKYEALAQAKCGRPFEMDDVIKRRHEKRLQLAQVIADKTKLNFEQWKREQEQKARLKQEKQEQYHLEWVQYNEEMRIQKLEKRRAEIEEDRAYLRQRELDELKLIEQENEQRRKNIEHYTELTEIVDAQHKRTLAEIGELKSQLSQINGETIAEHVDKDDTLVNVEHHVESDNENSDTDSVYFDADKSMTSSTSSKQFQSPEIASNEESPAMSKTPAKVPRSASDIFNSNLGENLAADRTRNKANVLNSNINLMEAEETVQQVEMVSGPLTEAQKNKMKIMQQEYGVIDANANANDESSTVVRMQLTDLQKNRQKVLSSEFGITDVVVNMTSDAQGSEDFQRNKMLAQSHSHVFEHINDVNANQPLTDLQINRQKVMIQEYGLNVTTCSSNDSNAIRNKLKSSLSLDLDSGKLKKSNLLSPKPCQSDFFVSPMSTTSDGLMANDDQSPSKADSDKNPLSLVCSVAQHHQSNNDEQFSSEIEGRATPSSALNSAGRDKHRNGFEFNAPYSSQPRFSQILRPTSTSSSIFDISSRLDAARNSKVIPPSPVHQPSKSLSKSELRDLIAGNLAHFLERSFTIPLKVYSNLINNEILKIFCEDLDILSHFHSLRNYFFMMDGEFASNICDGLLRKLQVVNKPGELFNSYTLHSILESALQSSLMGNDKNAENLSFCIPNIPDTFDMSSPKVLNELHLSYRVDWPLNLLLSVEAVEHYNVVFQHLLTLRRITWLLDQCFCRLKDIRKQSADKILSSPQYRHVQHMRHKLLCFVNALQSHITSIAIEGSWQKFQDDLKSVRSMEDLYKKHTKYLKRVKFLCMLNRSSKEFYVKVEDIFVVILRFCNKLQAKNWKCDNNGVYSHPNYDKLKKIEEDFTNLIKYIIYAGNKMSRCGYQTEIGEFIYMININGFYD